MNFVELMNTAHTISKDEFTKILKKLDNKYYSSNNSSENTLEDNQYDNLKDIYEERFGEYKSTGACIDNDKEKATLPYWLGSMNKFKPENSIEINKWNQKYSGPYLITEKLDGVSALLVNGSLYTRGNGVEGYDISRLIPYISIPDISDDSTNLAIRGEILINKKKFDKKYSVKYANARNLVSGIVNCKTLSTRLKIANDMEFVAYEIINPKNIKASKQLEMLVDLNFNVVKHETLNTINADNLVERLETYIKESEYEIDGLVIYDDNIHQRNKKDNPKYAFAFKIQGNIAETTVINVEWNASKHGLLKPRIQIEPIELSGATINWATGFNAKYINDNKIGPGSVIVITRSGEVIPHILSIKKESKSQMPDQDYEWTESGVDIILTNVENNNSVKTKIIVNFFSKMGIQQLNQKTIEKFVENGFNTIEKVIKITKKDIMKIEGFKDKSSAKIINNIKEGITDVPLERVMGSTTYFGHGIGRKKIEAILDTYSNILYMYNSMKMNVFKSKIMEIDGFSDKTADKFIDGLDKFINFLENTPEIKLLKKTKSSTVASVTATMQNINVVFTGVRDTDAEELIKLKGGKVLSSVSNNTTILVVKDKNNESSKIIKAKKLGIKIMELNEFKSEYL